MTWKDTSRKLTHTAATVQLIATDAGAMGGAAANDTQMIARRAVKHGDQRQSGSAELGEYRATIGPART